MNGGEIAIVLGCRAKYAVSTTSAPGFQAFTTIVEKSRKLWMRLSLVHIEIDCIYIYIIVHITFYVIKQLCVMFTSHSYTL